jgi:hypothetical protein
MQTLVFLVAAVMGVSAAQEKRQEDPRVLVVTGCVDRSWLKVISVDPFATHVDRLRLRGSKPFENGAPAGNEIRRGIAHCCASLRRHSLGSSTGST